MTDWVRRDKFPMETQSEIFQFDQSITCVLGCFGFFLAECQCPGPSLVQANAPSIKLNNSTPEKSARCVIQLVNPHVCFVLFVLPTCCKRPAIPLFRTGYRNCLASFPQNPCSQQPFPRPCPAPLPPCIASVVLKPPMAKPCLVALHQVPEEGLSSGVGGDMTLGSEWETHIPNIIPTIKGYIFRGWNTTQVIWGLFHKPLLGGGFKYVLFSSLLGEDVQFD